MSRNTSPEIRTGSASTWLLLGGVFLILLAVLGVTTHDRLQRATELMEQSLTQHGVLVVRSLEGATRAGMRRGMWRLNLLQALAEEMADHNHVRSIAILDHQGRILAAGGRTQSSANQAQYNPLDGLPGPLMRLVNNQRPVNHFKGGELIVGRPFEPLRGYLTRSGQLPSWARPLGGQHGRMFAGGHMDPAMMHAPRPPSPGGPPPEVDAREIGPPQAQRMLGGYVLVRMSTRDFEEARRTDLKQAFALAALIFLAAGGVAVGLTIYTRRRAGEIERLRAEVAANQHMAAVGRLAASVAHEVRNPLSALRGMVQFLTKEAEPGSREAEYGQVAVSEVDRLNRVVTSLLEYSRPRPLRRVELDLRELIHSVTELLADDPLAKKVTMEVKADEALPSVKADPDQLRQVLLNLVVNALQALNGQGRLAIEAATQDGQATVTVSDNGPGLDLADLDKVFDPFYSTRERGTGLGLAIARRIARAHGGELRADNQPGGGARFTLNIPISGA